MDICVSNVTVISKPLFSGWHILSTAELAAPLGTGAGDNGGYPPGVLQGPSHHPARSRAAVGSWRPAQLGCCWGRGCPFHETARLSQLAAAPVEADSGDRQAD